MSYKIYPPCKELRHVVQYFWSADINCIGNDFQISTFVDDSSGIIFHHNEGRNVLESRGTKIPKAILYGQITTPSKSFAPCNFLAVGVLFYPNTLNNIWKFNASDFKDNIQPLDNVLNIGNLTDIIINARNVDEQIQVLSHFLLKFVTKSDGNETYMSDVVAYIKSQSGMVRVPDVSDYFKISNRKLERDFKEIIGVTPTHFLQVSKFQKVLQELKTDEVKKLTTLALDYEYSDQPHFNRTFRKFSGFSPRQLRSLLNDDVVNLIV